MKITTLALASAASCLATAVPAAAQSLMPATAVGRYEMQPVDGGVARLDTQTGEVSLCNVEAGKLRCQPSEEDRARLESRIRELSGGRADPEAGNAPQPPAASEDADQEVDKAIDRMKKIFRAFRDITRDFDDQPTHHAPAPDRT